MTQANPVAFVNGDELDNLLNDREATISGKQDGWRNTPLFTASQALPDAKAIAAVIDPVAFDPISLNDTHLGWEWRREAALATASQILALASSAPSADGGPAA